MTDLEIYFENTQKPWGKLFYELVWDQLSFASGLKVIDFGSGFGITSNHLALYNEVIAVEPNEQMCQMRFRKNQYLQMVGGLEKLEELQAASFDLITCHNVLEYVDEKDDYIGAFSRLLKRGGKLSLVKHNLFGKVMAKAIFENDAKQALQLINGGASLAQNFGEIKYYDMLQIQSWMEMYGLETISHLGIRTFYALHPDNTIRNNEDWLSAMFDLEKKAGSIKEFRDVAFFNHVILEKR